jgi:hypothetical protein
MFVVPLPVGQCFGAVANIHDPSSRLRIYAIDEVVAIIQKKFFNRRVLTNLTPTLQPFFTRLVLVKISHALHSLAMWAILLSFIDLHFYTNPSIRFAYNINICGIN